MKRVASAVTMAVIVMLVAVGVSIVATVAVLLASLAGGLLSQYLPFTRFEATGLWLLAGAVVTLAAAVLFAAVMASGTQRAQQELLERLAEDADEWDDDEDEDDEDEDDEVGQPIFVAPKPREAAARRVLSRARRSR